MEYDLHHFHTCPIIQMPSFALLPSSINHYRPLCWAQVWFFSSNLNLSTFSVLQKIIPKKCIYMCVCKWAFCLVLWEFILADILQVGVSQSLTVHIEQRA